MTDHKLTDAEIDNCKTEGVHNWIKWRTEKEDPLMWVPQDDQQWHVSRAIEAAVTAPLLAKVAELEAALAEARVDAERHHAIRNRVGGRTEPNGRQVFYVSLPEPVSNIMRGSVAQHWDAAIDAMKGST